MWRWFYSNESIFCKERIGCFLLFVGPLSVDADADLRARENEEHKNARGLRTPGAHTNFHQPNWDCPLPLLLLFTQPFLSPPAAAASRARKDQTAPQPPSLLFPFAPAHATPAHPRLPPPGWRRRLSRARRPRPPRGEAAPLTTTSTRAALVRSCSSGGEPPPPLVSCSSMRALSSPSLCPDRARARVGLTVAPADAARDCPGQNPGTRHKQTNQRAVFERSR